MTSPLLFVSTCVVFIFEITLSRVFSYIFPYHFTSFAISSALLGLGLGSYVRVRFLPERPFPEFIPLGQIGFSLACGVFLFLIAVTRSVPAIIVGALPPFLFLGLLIAHFYESLSFAHARRTYFIDLMGGSLGCLLAVHFFSEAGLVRLIFLLGAFFSFLGALMGRRKPMVAILGMVVGLGASVGAVLSPDLLLSHLDSSKPLFASLLKGEGRVSASAWSFAGRADLLEDPGVKNVRWIYNDGTNSTLFVAEPRTDRQKEFLKNRFAFLPYVLIAPQSVLVVGSGGGYEVQLAKLAGVSAIDAVEYNPAIIDLVQSRKEFSGDVYGGDQVNLFVDEGRKFLMSSGAQYDLIQMSLVLTASAQSGTYALAEGFLYTVEAFQAYLKRLSPNGVLALIDDSRERVFREFATAVAALLKEGVPNEAQAMSHLAVFENVGDASGGYKYLLLLFKQPLTEENAAGISDKLKNRAIIPLWLPFHPSYPEFLSIGKGLNSALLPMKYDFTPVSDDDPFFFNFSRGQKAWRALLTPLAMVTLVALAGALWVAWDGRRRKILVHPGPSIKAFSLGAAFMMVELGLLQKLTLIFGGPVKTLGILLIAILIWCGLGSHLSSILSRRYKAKLAGFCLGAALLSACTVLGMGGMDRLWGISFEPLRIFTAIAALGPLGLALGMPFPTLLHDEGKKGQLVIAQLWGINGWGSVAGSALFLMVSLAGGFNAAILTGAFFYLILGLYSRPSKAGS